MNLTLTSNNNYFLTSMLFSTSLCLRSDLYQKIISGLKDGQPLTSKFFSFFCFRQSHQCSNHDDPQSCKTYQEQAFLVLLFHWFHVNAWNARWQWFLSIDELTTWYKSKKPSISYDYLFKTTFHKSNKHYLDFSITQLYLPIYNHVN